MLGLGDFDRHVGVLFDNKGLGLINWSSRKLGCGRTDDSRRASGGDEKIRKRGELNVGEVLPTVGFRLSYITQRVQRRV